MPDETDVTVESLQARLEEKRRRISQEAKEGGSTRTTTTTDVRPREETATCRRCGDEFVRAVLYVGDHRLQGFPTCDDCAAEERRIERSLSERHEPRPSLHDTMERIGVNVRKHGGCSLAAGTERGVLFDSSECGPIPLRTAQEFADEVVAAGPNGAVDGLLFCGPTGTGKTHLAVGIIRKILLQEPRWGPGDIVFDAADRFIIEAQDTYGSGQTAEFLERRDRAVLWVLDDLGSEKATEDALRLLFSVFNRREAHPTVVTTNYPPDELARRWKGNDWWARLASRLAGNFRIVKVEGSDKRFAA